MIGVPKSEKLTVKISKALEMIPGIASGNVTNTKLIQLLEPRFWDASSREISLNLNAATIGHRANGKKKKI